MAMLLLFRGIAITQIPVEGFVGHNRTTVDIMFFIQGLTSLITNIISTE